MCVSVYISENLFQNVKVFSFVFSIGMGVKEN